MKGIELPINVMIILVLCMIILIAVVALLYSSYKPSIGSVDLTTVKNNACQLLVSTGCSSSTSSIIISNFDANKDGEQKGGFEWTFGSRCGASGDDNLASLCECYYGSADDADCRINVCGCE